MKKLTTIGCVSIMMLSLGGCAGMSNQDVGVLTGGAIGGAVGSLFGGGSGKILAAVGGTVLGAYIGGRIGHTMDKVDKMKAQQALNKNRNNVASTWKNPNTGNQYTVTPTKTYYVANDQPCRDYTTTAIIGGKKETIYGKACRMADGTWKVKQ